MGAPRGCQGALGAVSEYQGCRGVRVALGMAGGLGAQPHWAQVQGTSTPTDSLWGVIYLTKAQAMAPVEGPITPTGFPWGVIYLGKAKQVTEMSSAGYYIHLELYLVTVCTFVSMLPHHIFLHAM